MDSYDRAVMDFLNRHVHIPTHFKYVKDEDFEEVADAMFRAFLFDLEDCLDNIRVFPEHLELDYEKVRRRGCCGYIDTSVLCNSGNRYLIGANYGH